MSKANNTSRPKEYIYWPKLAADDWTNSPPSTSRLMSWDDAEGGGRSATTPSVIILPSERSLGRMNMIGPFSTARWSRVIALSPPNYKSETYIYIYNFTIFFYTIAAYSIHDWLTEVMQSSKIQRWTATMNPQCSNTNSNLICLFFNSIPPIQFLPCPCCSVCDLLY